ncbi:hypothetical protein BDQ17DRAFT_1372347 [Cyathus striatus]|nr:hypothetical protein BDQ17DRAFT_1372347 [Cyathus striatus]
MKRTPPQPQQPQAHMFKNANKVNINGGRYDNASGAIIDISGPFDPAKLDALQRSLEDTRMRYGSNAHVSAFEGFSGGIQSNGRFQNAAGGHFSIVSDERNSVTNVPGYSSHSHLSPTNQSMPQRNIPPTRSDESMNFNGSRMNSLPPTQYQATMFKGANVENLQRKRKDVKIRNAMNIAGAGSSYRGNNGFQR